ncbi:hypothetical protein B0H63DRAFT_29086 [Podospora didyma]|uniref:Uncharacterized protein n=1 Tax=Podospora didyma TaxID=330526 RepID=A0AAE0U7M9_9PEZI|nr:hypothetical protein B0H63DRAFT_29086 [Podospora didyma]
MSPFFVLLASMAGRQLDAVLAFSGPGGLAGSLGTGDLLIPIARPWSVDSGHSQVSVDASGSESLILRHPADERPNQQETVRDATIQEHINVCLQQVFRRDSLGSSFTRGGCFSPQKHRHTQYTPLRRVIHRRHHVIRQESRESRVFKLRFTGHADVLLKPVSRLGLAIFPVSKPHVAGCPQGLLVVLEPGFPNLAASLPACVRACYPPASTTPL